jgi:mediator of RNA polymerase II transcription subunit 14
LRGKRVVVLDGSHSLFATPNKTTPPFVDKLGLLPIPDFKTIIMDTVKEAVTEISSRPAALDIGIICETSAIDIVGRVVHKRVLEILKDAPANR